MPTPNPNLKPNPDATALAATAQATTARAAKKKGRKQFYHKLFRAMLLAVVVIMGSLLLGILGYHDICGFGWVDSLLNASMILSGMGPVGELKTDGAKIFASVYALFSGVVFIMAAGILLGPMVHRVLHRFHIEEKDLH